MVCCIILLCFVYIYIYIYTKVYFVRVYIGLNMDERILHKDDKNIVYCKSIVETMEKLIQHLLKVSNDHETLKVVWNKFFDKFWKRHIWIGKRTGEIRSRCSEIKCLLEFVPWKDFEIDVFVQIKALKKALKKMGKQYTKRFYYLDNVGGHGTSKCLYIYFLFCFVLHICVCIFCCVSFVHFGFGFFVY